jgi:Flp pilus assembly protein TadD
MAFRSSRGGWRRDVAIGATLVAAIALVYAPVATYAFVDFDDPQYVSENVHVRDGLTVSGVSWAFTNCDEAIWDPATWLSHQLDAQLFGVRGTVLGLPASGWHHLTNVALHALAALLVYAALRSATSAPWRSAFVAGLFALHPLRVESVAWVAERKDVLSGAFGFAALLAYVQWTRRPTRGRYALGLALLACGLLAKPMLVTWPFVLLLVDFWPLERPIERRRLVEKLPHFALAAAVAVVTLFAERSAMKLTTDTSIATRTANALVSYAAYLGDTFWPSGLAVFHPFRASRSPLAVASSAALLVVTSGACLLARRRLRFLAFGACWFLGTLVPAIGLVQVGLHARADRFTYVPSVGLLVALVWLAGECASRWPRARPFVVGLGVAALVASAAASARQVRTWRDSETLFRHACEVTDDNAMAHGALGKALAKKDRLQEAMAEFDQALRIDPERADAHESRGETLARLGDFDAAIAEFRTTVRLDPRDSIAFNRLGCALLVRGACDEAEKALRESLRLDPSDAKVHHNLGSLLARARRDDEAADEYEAALRLDPRLSEARRALAALRSARR